MNVVLSVVSAQKRYGQTRALRGADLSLRRGECLALLGPNGAGKTTLIRAIAGRVKLDSGTITILNHTVGASASGSSADERSPPLLGVVPQDIAIYPLLTARENLRVFGELYGVRGATLGERIEWALQWTGLGERAESLAKTFSGGMKRRLNIACAVLHGPEIVLLDEPTVGVDPQSRQRIWEMLEGLRRGGASLLLTTHQLDEAQTVADRIVIIDHGRAIAEGSFAELVTQTIGTGRVVRFSLGSSLDDSALQRLSTEGFERLDGSQLSRRVDDVAGELPRLLSRIAEAGGTVHDLHVQSPSLQAVFIHLTGRELRE